MSNENVGLVVVGSGLWAGFYLSACERHERAHAIAVCNPNLASAERLGRRFGVPAVGDLDELLARDDVDAIAIVTPNDSHADLALRAAAAGKHVLCEKPMAMNIAEARAMTDAVDAAGLVSGINFTWRNPSAARYARFLVERGELGRLFHINGHFNQGWLIDAQVPRNWRLERARTGSGTLGDIGSHILDLAEWISGDRIVSLVAEAPTFVAERPVPGGGYGEVDVDDAVAILARTDSGALGNFSSSRYVRSAGMDQVLELHGERGALRMNFGDQASIAVSIGHFAREQQWVDAPIPARFQRTQQQYLEDNVTRFLDAIVEGEVNVPSFADGLRNQILIDAVIDSATSGRWVELT